MKIIFKYGYEFIILIVKGGGDKRLSLKYFKDVFLNMYCFIYSWKVNDIIIREMFYFFLLLVDLNCF